MCGLGGQEEQDEPRNMNADWIRLQIDGFYGLQIRSGFMGFSLCRVLSSIGLYNKVGEETKHG